MTEPVRGREIDSVAALADELRAGPPRPCLLELIGENGSGRTTVLTELGRRLEAAGWVVFRVEAHPGRGSTLRTLPDLATQLGSGISASSREALDLAVREALRRAERADLLLTDVALTGATASIVVALEERLGGRPAAWLVDDGHFVESLLLRFLGRVLVSSTDGPRLVVVATNGAGEVPVRIRGDLRVERHRLEPLGEPELAQLMREDGVAEELATAAAAALAGAWHRGPRAARLLAEELRAGPPPARLDDLVARGLRPLYEARIGRLTEAERELLQVASISASGINFWRLERLGVVARDEAASLTERLMERGILRPSFPRGKLRLIFRDPEERLVVYDSVDEETRRLFHARFARVVEEDDLDPADLHSEVGRHLILSGDELGGAASLLMAGRLLFQRGRVEEARRHLEEIVRRGRHQRALRAEALYATEVIADIESRTGSFEVAENSYVEALAAGEGLFGVADRVRLLRKIARGHLSQGKLADAEARIAAALALCPDAMLEEQAKLNDLLARLWLRHGDMGQASNAIQKALSLAVRSKGEGVLAQIQQTLATIQLDRGEVHAAVDALEAALELCEKTGDASGFAAVSNLLGNAKSSLGEPQEAIGHYRAALRIDRALSNHRAATGVLNNLAIIHMDAGELDEAERSLQECLRMTRRMGQHVGVCAALVNLSAIESRRGNHERALELVEEAQLAADEASHIQSQLAVKLSRAGAMLSLGRVGEALPLSREVEEQARATGNGAYLCWGLSSSAQCLVVLGDLDGARDLALGALETSQLQGWVEGQRDGLLLLSEIEMERGNLARAREHLERVRGTLGSTSDSQVERQRLQAVEIGKREGAEAAPLIRELELLCHSRESEVEGRSRRLLAELLAPADGLPHARRSHEIFAAMGMAEGLWRSALRLGELERELALAGADAHLDEAARTILSVAANLSDDQREHYLRSYGRRRVLIHAKGLD